MKVNPLPSRERLDELLDYNQSTGQFKWKIASNNRIKIGQIAGSIKVDRWGWKCLVIGIDGISYAAHRLAYFIVTNKQPKEIDHKNGNSLDNRFDNLRDGSGINNLNRTSGYESNVCGVMFNKQNNIWQATFGGPKFRKKYKTNKYFIDFFEAICQRKSWENKFGMTEAKKHRGS